MNKTQELLDKLRFTYSDNGAGHNTDFTLTLQQAADLIQELTERLNDKVPDTVQVVQHEQPRYLARSYSVSTCRWNAWAEITADIYYRLAREINDGATGVEVKKELKE
jgi:ABC-type Zn uptake system ZnuABC Zn-binding protein ZnuA